MIDALWEIPGQARDLLEISALLDQTLRASQEAPEYLSLAERSRGSEGWRGVGQGSQSAPHKV